MLSSFQFTTSVFYLKNVYILIDWNVLFLSNCSVPGENGVTTYFWSKQFTEIDKIPKTFTKVIIIHTKIFLTIISPVRAVVNWVLRKFILAAAPNAVLKANFSKKYLFTLVEIW